MRPATTPAGRSGSPASRSLFALCLLSFFLADVRDGLGPFLATHLQKSQVDQSLIGYALTAGGLASVAMTWVAGVWADRSSHKRWMVAIGSLVVMAGSVLAFESLAPASLIGSQIATGIGGAVVGAALAGLTLGIARHDGFKRQVGHNEAYNHAGNLLSALASGLLAHYLGAPWILAVMTAMTVGALLAILMIRGTDIDDAAARGGNAPGADAEVGSPWQALLRNAPLWWFALACAAFHFGNAAMLPLLNQRLAATVPDSAPLLWTSIAIVVAQLTMVPVALWVSNSRRFSLEVFVYAAFLILPLRGAVAYGLLSEWGNIPVQVLDGLAAGMLGVATPLLVERFTRETGFFNTALGVLMTVQGVGAAFSPLLANSVVGSEGRFGTAFIALSLAGLVALPLFWLTLRARPRPPTVKETRVAAPSRSS